MFVGAGRHQQTAHDAEEEGEDADRNRDRLQRLEGVLHPQAGAVEKINRQTRLAGRLFQQRQHLLCRRRLGNRWQDGEPGYVVLRATDPNLFQCPFLFASDAGTMALDDAEAMKLREYLLKGGFFWADDFWGDRAWEAWESQIRRVLPGYRIEEISPGHRLLSTFYQVDEIPQIPSIQFWRGSGGATSERGMESAEPRLRAIVADDGRIMVLMSHNTDIADGWEREGEDPRFLDAFSPDAYALGINIALWAMTH